MVPWSSETVSERVTVAVKVPFPVETLWVAVEDDVLGNALMTAATMLGMLSFVSGGASVRRRFPMAGEVGFTPGGVFLLLFLSLVREEAEDLQRVKGPLLLRLLMGRFSSTTLAYFSVATTRYCTCVVLNSALLS